MWVTALTCGIGRTTGGGEPRKSENATSAFFGHKLRTFSGEFRDERGGTVKDYKGVDSGDSQDRRIPETLMSG